MKKKEFSFKDGELLGSLFEDLEMLAAHRHVSQKELLTDALFEYITSNIVFRSKKSTNINPMDIIRPIKGRR